MDQVTAVAGASVRRRIALLGIACGLSVTVVLGAGDMAGLAADSGPPVAGATPGSGGFAADADVSVGGGRVRLGVTVGMLEILWRKTFAPGRV